jgi:hypothetical protein
MTTGTDLVRNPLFLARYREHFSNVYAQVGQFLEDVVVGRFRARLILVLSRSLLDRTNHYLLR